MKVEITKENNQYLVMDEFNLVHEIFETSDEAMKFLLSKFANTDVLRATFYIQTKR